MDNPVARRATMPGQITIAGGTTVVGGGHPRHARRPGWALWHKDRRDRFAAGITVLGALVIAIISIAWLSMTRPASSASVPTSRQASAAAEPSAGASRASARSSTKQSSTQSIRLTEPVGPAKPFQAVPISGTQPGASDSLLQVQRTEGDRWVAFPLPTKTDPSGRFSTYVELGKPGRYWVRVLDPHSGATSNRFLLVIKA